jgi:mannitol/fructose-specific phosphotransferase system IIA component
MDHEGLLDEKRRLERELFELKAKNVELQAKVDDQQDRLEKICDVLEKTNYYDPEHVVKLHKNELDEYYLHSMAMVKAAVDLTGMWITGPEKMPG